MNQLLDIFEIQDRVDDIIEDFSHGMKRKIALIAALIHNPDVLFLDEPTIGLDPRSAHHLKNLLRELVRKGKTIFMTTHILELAEKMCDRIGIIHKGRLIMVNTAENIQKDIESSKKSLEDVFLDLTQTDQTSSIKEYLKTV
jgi:ABC-2 type transport system ATP-binding protein